MARPEGQKMTDQDVPLATPQNEDNDAERPERSVAEQLVDQARAAGVDLVGPGGLLSELTKQVLETGLEVEMEEHLGYEKHAVEGRDHGNSRNGTRSKTVITEIGPVDLEVPRDRDGSFSPKTVKKRQRRFDSMAISLTAKGLTTGEVEAHLIEVYSTEISRETISKITDQVLEEMADWQNRPLDRARVSSDLHRRPVGRDRRRRRQILAPGVDRNQEPWRRRRVHGRVRRTQRTARINRSGLATGVRADLRAAPHPQHPPPRVAR